LGCKGSPSFSVVIDDLGIYYDATRPSRLETILAEYDFDGDADLRRKAEHAIGLIKNFKISKYNAADEAVPPELSANPGRKKILIIAQTRGDMSLKYGFGDQFSTNRIIDAATRENPGCDIFLKIHPDVLAGRKQSDLIIDQIPAHCRVVTENTNPLALLERVDKVYTKTSQMGFEALLLGKECVCFGMPFYAGWGLTDDRVACDRRERKLTVHQVFTGAYILYSLYYNPYLRKESDIIDTLYTIKDHRQDKIT
jgi:capsular polysaccharide export protein